MNVKLTEAEAWEVIAERFACGNTYSGDGLCWLLDTMYMNGDTSHDTMESMGRRVQSYLQKGQTWAYEMTGETNPHYKWCVTDDEGRALAALWMACEARDEAQKGRK